MLGASLASDLGSATTSSVAAASSGEELAGKTLDPEKARGKHISPWASVR